MHGSLEEFFKMTIWSHCFILPPPFLILFPKMFAFVIDLRYTQWSIIKYERSDRLLALKPLKRLYLGWSTRLDSWSCWFDKQYWRCLFYVSFANQPLCSKNFSRIPAWTVSYPKVQYISLIFSNSEGKLHQYLWKGCNQTGSRRGSTSGHKEKAVKNQRK